MKRFTDWMVYLAVRLFICIVQALPIQCCATIARALSLLACDVLRIRETVVDENLQQAFPEWSVERRRQIARRMWQHLALLLCELAHVPRKIHPTNWREYLTIRDPALQVEMLLSARPVVMVSGHFGNFEVGGYAAGLLGFPTFTVARTLDNPYLEKFVQRFRGATGQFMLPKKNSAQRIAQVLEQGHALAFLGDQYAGAKGCWVNFFGRPASCHKAIALFSLTTGAPLLVTYARRLNRPLHFEIGVAGVVDPERGDPPASDARELTQWYNNLLEQEILKAPDQYWWLHRRWKGQPRKRRRRTDAAEDQPSPPKSVQGIRARDSEPSP